jgi:hypothetical protein
MVCIEPMCTAHTYAHRSWELYKISLATYINVNASHLTQIQPAQEGSVIAFIQHLEPVSMLCVCVV